MKKVIFALLLVTLVIALMSCGGSGVDTDTDTATDTATDTQTDTQTPDSSDSNTEVESGTNSETQVTDSNKDSETNKDTQTDTNSSSGTDTSTNKPSTPSYTTPTVEGELKTELGVFNTNPYGNEGTVKDFTTTNSVNLAVDAFNKQFMIDKGGSYRLYGTVTSGGIYVKAKNQDVILVLDGVNITSKNNYPPIYAEDCKSLTIILKEGTNNVLTDTSNNDGENAVIRVRSCNLKITGTGALEINANSKYGISNTKELTIDSGNIKINSPSHAIYGKMGVNINGGNLSLNSSKKSGIKSGDAEDKDGAVTGYINISGSSMNIKCLTNGIKCDGSVSIIGGKIIVDAAEGNAIDASDNIAINGGILVFNSYKSAVSTDGDVLIGGNANLKLTTKGNGISANNVAISTSGVVYIKTTAEYVEITGEVSAETTRYCLDNGQYVKYDPLVHGINKKLYVRKDCRGVEADGTLTVTNGIIGVNSYEDAFNVKQFVASGGRFVLATKGDAIDASESVEMSDAVEFNVLNAEKGLKASNVLILGGTFKITAEKDSINANSTIINGGTLYLFEKIDLGTSGTVMVNGATILMVCTNNKAQSTEGTSSYISNVVANKDIAVAGRWLRIKSGSDEVLVQLTKNYTEKMVVYYASSSMGDSLTLELGTISNKNVFVVEKTEEIK